MPATLLYEYAVVRLVPRVEREEFINVGVVLYCRQKRAVEVRLHLDEARLLALAPGADVVEIQSYLDAFSRIARGEAGSGPIGALDAAGRFRWLTAVRSTVVQTSRVHPGMCTDPGNAVEHLLERFVTGS
ncbi:DUF3037 domain-containing protein [Flaviaesturariibacter flavus]|uniref:DUF3037 domain-containing protein n=1 Tax=Flaviaesturariibacter flavus TaxID=2502780 RepID=A0A4R1BPF0_9BACT|nr:DUF3037 domain-containing protein [Flaviaesturariibacter flavus]TCJ19348.1 DUF3037 domain-containing protein [Flaviaesturariibacter flavus]